MVRVTRLTTPRLITEQVRAFCRVQHWLAPVFAPVEIGGEAREDNCFYNVRSLVERAGGSLCLGWCIWLWPKVFIEGEHHCIWRDPSGRLVDVTPKADGEARVVFAEDPGATFDWDGPLRRDNIRRSLVADRRVAEYLELSEQLSKIKLQGAYLVGKELFYKVDGKKVDELQARRGELEQYIRKKFK